jgi:hypothetical protein
MDLLAMMDIAMSLYHCFGMVSETINIGNELLTQLVNIV